MAAENKKAIRRAICGHWTFETKGQTKLTREWFTPSAAARENVVKTYAGQLEGGICFNTLCSRPIIWRYFTS